MSGHGAGCPRLRQSVDVLLQPCRQTVGLLLRRQYGSAPYRCRHDRLCQNASLSKWSLLDLWSQVRPCRFGGVLSLRLAAFLFRRGVVTLPLAVQTMKGGKRSWKSQTKSASKQLTHVPMMNCSHYLGGNLREESPPPEVHGSFLPRSETSPLAGERYGGRAEPHQNPLAGQRVVRRNNDLQTFYHPQVVD